MKKTLLLLVLSAALCSGAAAKDNLAVLPFTGGSVGEGETIAELFSFNNELNQVFSPIPRTSIARAIGNEQKFQAGAGMTDPDTIAAIGRQLGASYVVAGNITRLGNLNLLIISILKIDDLRQIAGDIQTYAKIEEIQAKLPGMARNIITASQINISGLDKLAVVPVELGGNIDSREADTLAQILSINLIRSGKYLVYPRTETLEQVQAEYKTQLSGVTADEHLVDMGKGDNPRFVLSVAARRLGSQNMFNASIINLESGVQAIGRSVNYNTLDDGMQVMASLARELTGISGAFPSADSLEPVRDSAAAEAVAAGDRAKEEAAAKAARSGGKAKGARKSGGAVFGYGILNLALGLGSFIQGDPGGGAFALLSYGAAAGLIAWDIYGLAYEDELAGIPGTVGLGAAGFAVLYGFIRPAVYNRSRPLAEIVDRLGVSIVPGSRGGKAALLSYTIKF
jgi:TolB-like protein